MCAAGRRSACLLASAIRELRRDSALTGSLTPPPARRWVKTEVATAPAQFKWVAVGARRSGTPCERALALTPEPVTRSGHAHRG